MDINSKVQLSASTVHPVTVDTVKNELAPSSNDAVPKDLKDVLLSCWSSSDLKVWNDAWREITLTDFGKVDPPKSNFANLVYVYGYLSDPDGKHDNELIYLKLVPNGESFKLETVYSAEQATWFTQAEASSNNIVNLLQKSTIAGTNIKFAKNKCGTGEVKLNPTELANVSSNPTQALYICHVKHFLDFLCGKGNNSSEFTLKYTEQTSLSKSQKLVSSVVNQSIGKNNPFTDSILIKIADLIVKNLNAGEVDKNAENLPSYILNTNNMTAKGYFTWERLNQNQWERQMVLSMLTYRTFASEDKFKDWALTVASYYEIVNKKVRFNNQYLRNAFKKINVSLKDAGLNQLKGLAFSTIFDVPELPLLERLRDVDNKNHLPYFETELNTLIEKIITQTKISPFLELSQYPYRSIEDIDKILDLIEKNYKASDEEEEEKDDRGRNNSNSFIVEINDDGEVTRGEYYASELSSESNTYLIKTSSSLPYKQNAKVYLFKNDDHSNISLIPKITEFQKGCEEFLTKKGDYLLIKYKDSVKIENLNFKIIYSDVEKTEIDRITVSAKVRGDISKDKPSKDGTKDRSAKDKPSKNGSNKDRSDSSEDEDKKPSKPEKPKESEETYEITYGKKTYTCYKKGKGTLTRKTKYHDTGDTYVSYETIDRNRKFRVYDKPGDHKVTSIHGQIRKGEKIEDSLKHRLGLRSRIVEKYRK